MPTIPGSDDEKVMPQQPAEAKPGHTEEDEDPSGDEDIHVEPGVCPCCEQRIGEQDKDALPGVTMTVTTPKQDAGLPICLKCSYIKRGSFKKLTVGEFLRLKRKCRPLSDKIASLRRKLVQALCRNPKAKPRHEVVDHKFYTTRTSSDYIDFRQEGTWHDLKEYFDKVADEDSKKKLRSVSQKKAYLEKLGIRIQADERGVEGVVIIEGPKKVLLGHRMSASKTKQSEHADKASMDELQKEDAAKLQISAQTKDEEERALAEPVQEEDSEKEVEDEKENNSSDEDDWGVAQKGPGKAKQKQAQPKRRPKAAAPSTSGTEKSERGGEGGGEGEESMPPPPPPKPSANVPKNVDKLVAQSGTVTHMLQQVNPLLVWQNPGKFKDCESKPEKATAYLAGLEAAEQTEKVREARRQLFKVAKDLDNWCNLVNNIKASFLHETSDVHDFMNYIAENLTRITKLLALQSAECVKLALVELGRLYAEASVVPGPLTDGYRSALFQFLSMEELEQYKSFSHISFGKIFAAGTDAGNKALDKNFFLQVQASIFNGWLDRLRTASDEATHALRLWEHAVSVSKNILTEKKAEEVSATVLGNVQKLNSFLDTPDCSPSEEFQELLSGCKDLMDVASAMGLLKGDSGSATEQPEVNAEIGKALNELREKMKTFAMESMTKLGDWFTAQWPLKPEAPGFDVTQKENFSALTSILKTRGQICTTVLKEDPEMYLRLLWVIEKVEGFIGQGASLSNAWKLSKGIHDDLRVARMPVYQSGSWASPCTRASLRLKQLVVQQGPNIITKLIQDKNKDGINEAKSMLCGLEDLEGRLLGMRSVREDQGNFEVYSKDAPNDLVQICKHASAIAKAVNYDMDTLQAVKPEAKSAIEDYLEKVRSYLNMIIGNIERDGAKWEKIVLRYKPVIAVAEMWQAERLAEINWMFTSNEDVDKDTKSMVTFRDELPCHLQPMKGIVACKAALRADQKLYEVVDMLHSLRKRSRSWPA
ncbi:unnamed protein product [Durusdinium trenchii]|uniref:Uncharacterized protein n=1 Tax=Durusdinium trenchii TaxID=1381693 RepID=A0ABP0QT81_9DINO